MLKPYYQDSLVTIYNGDCYTMANEFKYVELVVTDPPYLLKMSHGGGAFGNRKSLRNTANFTDGGCDYSILDNFNNWFCFCSRKQIVELINKAEQKERWNFLVWCKTNPLPTCHNTYLSDLEFIIHGFNKNRLFGKYKDKSQFVVSSTTKKVTKHPNEKPIHLIEKLIILGSVEGETILDPFAGSGTTGVACKQLNRKCIMIERSEEYCEVAAKRLQTLL